LDAIHGATGAIPAQITVVMKLGRDPHGLEHQLDKTAALLGGQNMGVRFWRCFSIGVVLSYPLYLVQIGDLYSVYQYSTVFFVGSS
jgi:hypothetical protein